MAERYYTRVATEAIRPFVTGGLTTSFQAFGDPIRHEARQVIFNNDTNQPVFISDGPDYSDDSLPNSLKAKYFIPADGDLVLDLTTNRTSAEGLYYPSGTQFYVAAVDTLPTSGEGVYMSVIYSSGG